jgi:H+/gluconate symporter-like permease
MSHTIDTLDGVVNHVATIIDAGATTSVIYTGGGKKVAKTIMNRVGDTVGHNSVVSVRRCLRGHRVTVHWG